MELRDMFDLFMNEYQNGNHETAIYYGMDWIANADENPFTLDTPEREFFFQAKRNLKKWNMGGIDFRISRTRLIHNLESLGELNLLNPYKPIDPTFRVLGVIPDDKVEEILSGGKKENNTDQSFINKEDKLKEEINKTEEIKKEVKSVEVEKKESKTIKEIKEDVSNDRRKKHFFGGRKKEAEEERKDS